MRHTCRQCGSVDLRPSHLQRGDWHYFIRLRYPVRCRSCRRRGAVNLFMILLVWHRHKIRIARSGRRYGGRSSGELK